MSSSQPEGHRGDSFGFEHQHRGACVARIEPIPFEDLPAETQAMMEADTASGMYTTCSSFLGGHRFMRAIGAFAAMGGETTATVLAYEPGSVDRSRVGAQR